MHTLTEENYLKALYHLTIQNDAVAVNEISKYLNIKMPSVNSMMRKFAEKDWVKYTAYKPISLTAEGRRIAAQIVRKHRLTEMFLVEKMGFGWDEVHEIAEQLEHIDSEPFFDKIDFLLDYPKTDPHGSPIPDKKGVILQQDFYKLSECKAGDKVIFSALAEAPSDFLKFLNKKNLSLNTEIEVLSVEDFDESVSVKYSGEIQQFSALVCERILVQKL